MIVNNVPFKTLHVGLDVELGGGENLEGVVGGRVGELDFFEFLFLDDFGHDGILPPLLETHGESSLLHV